MEMLDLVQKYRNKLQTDPHDISCLLFALQIPSICSRIDFPQTPENTGKCEDGKFYRSNGKTWDANMYKAWLKKYRSHFVDIYSGVMTTETFCDNLYELRNQVTHEGVLMSDKNKFYFIESDRAMGFEGIVFIPIKRLCEEMFDAAYQMLSRQHESINITLFDDMLVPSDIFKYISNDVPKTYCSFWDNRPEDDNILNAIYDHIIFDKPSMKKNIEEFFAKTPNAVFEIWDFGCDYGYITDTKERFIHQDYKRKTDVLRLNKQQYERMLMVVTELDDFSKSHPFDITKYIKEKIS